MESRRWIVLLGLLALPACAANRAPGDAGPRAVDAAADAGAARDGGAVPPSASARRLVVHDARAPSLAPPASGRYLAVELSLVNERGAPEAALFEGAFTVTAPGRAPLASLAPPEGWRPAVTPCPVAGTVPDDGFLRCTALFAVPVGAAPDRLRYVGEPGAAALLSAEGPVDAQRLCEAAAESATACRVCVVEATEAACASTVAAASRLCARGLACEALAGADDACASAVGAQHLCIEAACPACGYVSGVR